MVGSTANSISNTVGGTVSGVTNTLTIQNPSNTASSVAQLLLTVGGTTSGSPWLQWTVGSTESFALGQNNSSTQKLFMNYNNSASVSPTTGTNMLAFDHTAPGIVLGASENIVFNTSGAGVGSAANNGVSIYESGTFTPTVAGGSTAGTPVYTQQFGYYIRYGGFVDAFMQIAYTSISGTPAGDIRLGALPYTINSGFGGAWGPLVMNSASTPFPTGTTQENYFGQANQTYGVVNCYASGVAAANMQIVNTGAPIIAYSLFYRV